MLPISAAIIARDEADRIEEAIRSVSFADEVLVLDTGSADATVAVAEAAGARVIRTAWQGHVAAKTEAMAAVRHPWVLSIDADERVSEALVSSIRVALAVEPAVDGFVVRRRNVYLGTPLRGGRWYPDARIRLVRRIGARWVGEDPHDRLVVDGAVQTLAGDLVHVPYRDFSEHLATIDRYTARFVEQNLGSRRARLPDVLLRPPWAFARAFLLDRGYRDGVLGLLLAALGAVHTLVKWTRLYLAQRGRPWPSTRTRGNPLSERESGQDPETAATATSLK